MPSELLASLREDEAFPELLALARTSNALRFGLAAAFSLPDGIVGERQRNSSFLLTAATLSEALHTLPRMGKYFRELPAYAELLAPILTDNSVRDLRGKVLKWLRDKAVFHQDREVAAAGLADMEGTWTFAEGDSDNFLDVAYPLGDFVIVRAVLEQIETKQDLVAGFADVLSQTLALAKTVLFALDSLIGQALNAYGLTIEQEG